MLCYPGLSAITTPLKAHYTSGEAYVFSTGNTHEDLELDAGIVGSQNLAGAPASSASQVLVVENKSKATIRWALLLAGSARMSKVTPVGISEESLTVAGSGVYSAQGSIGQIYWGTLKANGSVALNGAISSNFYSSSDDRTAVALPSYGEEALSNLSVSDQRTIIKAIGSRPALRATSSFTAQIDSTPASPVDTLTTNVTPAAEPILPDTLQWTTHSSEAVQYETEDQDLAEEANDTFFVFAVLLGIAGGGIVASLQSIVHTLTSRAQARTD
jgi:hypothetical protein